MDIVTPTKLDYYQDMRKLESEATLLSLVKGEDGRTALVLDRTVFHPQGGGQPADTGFISVANSELEFVVKDVRSKDGVVYHYGLVNNSCEEWESKFEKGKVVFLKVDETRRKLNSRLHSAGHLIDVCMKNVGLGDLKPGKGYHFPQGGTHVKMVILFPSLLLTPEAEWFLRPYVEYIGMVPQNDAHNKREELEIEANALLTRGGKVSVALVPYEEACTLCGECLPDYIPKDSTPRIVKLGNNPGCPCGGTHVSDISEIVSITVSQIRTKKGITKVFYNVGT